MDLANWYALGVYARQEKATAGELRRRGFEVLLPVRVERRAWSDRIQDVELALFPGYLFVRTLLSASRRVELLSVRGSIEVVGRLPGDPRVARPIADSEIESLKVLLSSARHLDPVERLVAGTPVVVAGGALQGARGLVTHEADGKRRLVVQIELLGRGVRTVLSADDVVEEEREA